jgi:putative restriction endonuclease
MRAFVAVTDGDWYAFLSNQPALEEVNFWQPGGGRDFRVLSLGEPLLFKLHYPNHFIVGGGFFLHFTRLPVSRAWEAFGIQNGASSFLDMRRRVEKYRRGQGKSLSPHDDYEIGCIILEEPFFLPRERWIPAPDNFARPIVTGKSYDLAEPMGKALWQLVVGERAASRIERERPAMVDGPVFGEAVLKRVRLGQGAFQALVIDAYQRRCAISGEKAFPVLQAAHIRPVAHGGLHRLDNGLLLRSDIHTLFDKGYMAIRPDNLTVMVSSKLKEDYDNGEPYYPLRDKEIAKPVMEIDRPGREFLEWHVDTVYRG